MMIECLNVSGFQGLNLYGAKVIYFSVNSKFSAQIVIFLRIKQVILRLRRFGEEKTKRATLAGDSFVFIG
jgi:hypothetical protein